MDEAETLFTEAEEQNM